MRLQNTDTEKPIKLSASQLLCHKGQMNAIRINLLNNKPICVNTQVTVLHHAIGDNESRNICQQMYFTHYVHCLCSNTHFDYK